MKWLTFKNRIKNDLYNYESEEDALDIWDSINSDVVALNEKNKKKNNRSIFFLLFLVGFAGVIYLAIPKKQSEANQKIIRQSISINSLEESNKLENNKTSTAKNLNDTKDTKDTRDTRDRRDTRDARDANESNESNEIQKPNTKTNDKSQNSKTRATTSELRQELIAKHDIVNVNFSDLRSADLLKATSPEKVHEYQAHGEIIENEIALQTTFPKTIVENGSDQMLVGTSFIDLLNLGNLELISSTNLPDIPNLNKIFINDKLNIKRKFSLGLNVGVFQTFQKLEAKESGALDFLNSRKATESFLETVHARFYGDYSINKNINVSIGLGFTRMTQEFRFLETAQEINLITGVKYIFTGPGVNPSRLNEVGMLEETKTTITNYVLYNQYDLLDFPILISYKWNTYKWAFGLQAGIIANLHFDANGRILESEIRSEEIEVQNPFKKRLGMSYALNLIFEHRVNNTFSIVCSPSFRYLPNSITNDDYALDQKHKFLGADLGVKYYFKSK